MLCGYLPTQIKNKGNESTSREKNQDDSEPVNPK